MSRWRVLFTRQAQKDARKLASSNLESKAQYLLDVLRKDPLQAYPSNVRGGGGAAGAYSRRINVQHRLVYQILPEEHVVKVIRMWTHYE